MTLDPFKHCRYCSDAARNVLGLQSKHFTHILNTALGKGRYHSDTNHVMYEKVGIKFMGKGCGLLLRPVLQTLRTINIASMLSIYCANAESMLYEFDIDVARTLYQ